MSHRGYWDYFVDQWKSCSFGDEVLEWTSPDGVPSYKSGLSSLYIPEPWWGNDGNDPLHSVVINYNPGKGGFLQERHNLPYFSSYSTQVVKINQLCLVETACWHWKNRGKPIHEALGLKGTCLKNHLSIELIPWHSSGLSSKYTKYLKDNIQRVYEHCILFAAEESTRIQNSCLKNVVILRMSGNSIDSLLKLLNKALKISTYKLVRKDIASGTYLIIKIIDNKNSFINNVTFVSIWGSNTRNNFPDSLRLILNDVCKYKRINCNTISSISHLSI